MVTRISIPFTLPEVYHGLAEAHGRARVGDSGLHIEYRVEDAVFGVLKSSIRELDIPFEDIDDVRLIDGWFRCRIVVHLHSLHTIADFPGSQSGRLELKLSREHRERAREFYSHLSLCISEERLRRIEQPGEWEGD
jgi:hypothetical protein